MKYDECILIHYGEIGTKGKNRKMFELALINNIRDSALNLLNIKNMKIKIDKKRVFISSNQEHIPRLMEMLPYIFGIENFSLAYLLQGKKDEWIDFILEHFPKEYKNAFMVKTKRVDKSLPYTSLDFSRELGKRIVDEYGAKIDLHEKKHVVYVEILGKEKALVYFLKHIGHGGLPVGCAGKGLCLLSGGIDSPVAAWRMMSRGLKQDFLHIRPFTKFDENNKVYRIVKELCKWEGGRAKLYTTTCVHFSKNKNLINKRYAAILFRIFLHKLGEKIAEKEKMKMLINGDALSQVASQTTENIFLVDRFLSIPIARPLISFSKKEIIAMAERINTYALSIEPYKDCCAMLVSMPTTKGKFEKLKEQLDAININEIVDKTFEEMECWDVHV